MLSLIVVAATTAIFSNVTASDKLYVHVSFFFPIFACLLVIVIKSIHRKKIVLRQNLQFAATLTLLLFAVLGLNLLARSAYLITLSSQNAIPTYIAYSFNAILIILVYDSFSFNLNNYRKFVYIFLLVLLCGLHAIKSVKAIHHISEETRPLKVYFDQIRYFINAHRNEEVFSFKVISRPPNIPSFEWYSQTCIDGLYNEYIDYNNPHYILSYDYNNGQLECHQNSNFNPPSITCESFEYEHIEADFINSIGMKFASFGQNRSLAIGICEVTQKQWLRLMENNPSIYLGNDRPVENVTYKMALEFIQKLNEIEPAAMYRLPTLEEYEYIINAAVATYSIKQQDLYRYGWLYQSDSAGPQLVCTKSPFPKDIYDIIGNVWEWTSTVLHPGSPAASYPDNPRYCFGASWSDNHYVLKNPITNYPPDFHHQNLGFRLIVNLR